MLNAGARRNAGADSLSCFQRAMLSVPLKTMQATHANSPISSSRKRWTRAFARAIAPRKHLRVLPTRTRPSLFGSD